MTGWLRRAKPVLFFALACTVFSIAGCVATEPRPAGVPRSVAFSVSPVYPKSFEIVAFSGRGSGAAGLKDAWQKKANQVANGRRFKTSPLIVRDTENLAGGWPIQGRTVLGTITLIE